MVSAMKTMGVIAIIMLFFVATTVAIPCCDGEYTSCCKTGDVVNITTFANVTTYAKVAGHVYYMSVCLVCVVIIRAFSYAKYVGYGMIE
ncbi:hypothetical protein Tco_0821347 [Tanacetum coccineum]|uniref:Uncharacterized protein n=1 Tax=Tanacetum coccineum TaxID=301880 RepID=A0ABQ5AG44_9ASTR